MMLMYLAGSCELSEAVILKEVIFAFQGISGNYIHYDAATESFALDTKVSDAAPAAVVVVFVLYCLCVVAVFNVSARDIF